jgi:hypothetical protein
MGAGDKECFVMGEGHGKGLIDGLGRHYSLCWGPRQYGDSQHLDHSSSSTKVELDF